MNFTDSKGSSYEIVRGEKCGFYVVIGDHKRYLSKDKVAKLKQNARKLGTSTSVAICKKGKKASQNSQPQPEPLPQVKYAEGWPLYQDAFPKENYSDWRELPEDRRLAWYEAYLLKNPVGFFGGLFADDPWETLPVQPLSGEELEGFGAFVLTHANTAPWKDLKARDLAGFISSWNDLKAEDRDYYVFKSHWADIQQAMREDVGFNNWVMAREPGIEPLTVTQYFEQIDKGSETAKNLMLREYAAYTKLSDHERQKFQEAPVIPPAPTMELFADKKGNVIGAMDKSTGSFVSVNEPGMKTPVENAVTVEKSNPVFKEIKNAPTADDSQMLQLQNAMEAYQQRKLSRSTCQQQGKVWDPVSRLCVTVATGTKEDLEQGFYKKHCKKGFKLEGNECVGIKVSASGSELRNDIVGFSQDKLKRVNQRVDKCELGWYWSGKAKTCLPVSVTQAVDTSDVMANLQERRRKR